MAGVGATVDHGHRDEMDLKEGYLGRDKPGHAPLPGNCGQLALSVPQMELDGPCLSSQDPGGSEVQGRPELQ